MNPYQQLLSATSTLLTDLSTVGGPETFDAFPDIPGDIVADLRRTLQEADMGLRVMLDEVTADSNSDGTQIAITLIIGIVARETITAAQHDYNAGAALTVAWQVQQLLQGHSLDDWEPFRFDSLRLVQRGPVTAYEISVNTSCILVNQPPPIEPDITPQSTQT